MIKLRTIDGILAAVPRWAAVALSIIGVACLAVLIAVQANAITHARQGGPAESPGGTYFQQGTLVGFCFVRGTNRGWLEWNTTLPGGLGNCPPNATQLDLWADPDGVVPGPVATVTVTATPSG